MVGLKKIAIIEAFGIMNESHHKQYEDKKNEIESLGYDLTGWSNVFFLDESRKEVVCEFVDAEEMVRYRLMFQLSSVGRPSMGTTKKVSVTLPDETWEKVEKKEPTKSAFFRKAAEESLSGEDPQTKDIQNKMYPNFEIKCQVCGSKKVTIENSIGYSDISGGWGEITFKCQLCGNSTDVYEHE